MRGLLLAVTCVGVVFCLVSCGDPPQVYQGTVTAYDAGAKILHVQNQRVPDEVKAFSLEGAEIGAPPSPGDQVRLAYRETGGRAAASRVMNLTRQDELSGKSKKR